MKRAAALSLMFGLVACGIKVPPRAPNWQPHDAADPDATACRGGDKDACFAAGKAWTSRSPGPPDDVFAATMYEKGCKLGHGGSCYEVGQLILSSFPPHGPYEVGKGRLNFVVAVMERGCEHGDLDSCMYALRLREPGSPAAGLINRRKELDMARRACELGYGTACKTANMDAVISEDFATIAEQYKAGFASAMPVKKVIKQVSGDAPIKTQYSQGGPVSVFVWDPTRQLREVCFEWPERDLIAKAAGVSADRKACTSTGMKLAGGRAVGGQLPWSVRPGETAQLRVTTTPPDLKVVVSLVVPE